MQTDTDLEQVLQDLQINKQVWDAYMVSEEARYRAGAALSYFFEQLDPVITSRELKRRGIVVEDLCQGSWIVVRMNQSTVALAVLLGEISPNKIYRCWFGDGTTSRVHVIDVMQHLTNYYPAPIALSGKTVLPKAKIQFAQIEAALADGSNG